MPAAFEKPARPTWPKSSGPPPPGFSAASSSHTREEELFRSLPRPPGSAADSFALCRAVTALGSPTCGAGGGGPITKRLLPRELLRCPGAVQSVGRSSPATAAAAAAAPGAGRLFIQEAQARHFLLPIRAALQLQVMVLTLCEPPPSCGATPSPAAGSARQDLPPVFWDGRRGDPEQGAHSSP